MQMQVLKEKEAQQRVFVQHYNQLGRRQEEINQVRAVYEGRKDKDVREMNLSAPETIHSMLPLLKQGATGHLQSGRQITSLISNREAQTGRRASNTQKIPAEPASFQETMQYLAEPCSTF